MTQHSPLWNSSSAAWRALHFHTESLRRDDTDSIPKSWIPLELPRASPSPARGTQGLNRGTRLWGRMEGLEGLGGAAGMGWSAASPQLSSASRHTCGGT